jgi:hypothetical protein
VTVTAAQLRQLATIMQRIEEGRIDTPRAPGDFGAFLRQFATARETTARAMGVELSGRGWVSGEHLVPLALSLITSLELRIDTAITGSVSAAIAVCETLGTTLSVTLWGAPLAASRMLREWRARPTSLVSLAGRFRWYPPGRITPGEAMTEACGQELPWHQVRCLKYTADDLGRVPHAANFHLDWLTSPPGIRAYRTFAIQREGDRWRVFPGLARTATDISVSVPPDFDRQGADRLLVLASTEPWEPKRWTIAEARPATDDDVLAHSIAWADHVRELAGEGAITGDEMRALAAHARELGVANASLDAAASAAALTRRLDPRAISLARLTRGTT